MKADCTFDRACELLTGRALPSRRGQQHQTRVATYARRR